MPAKATKLAHTAEAMLLAFFSLQDQLSREDAAVLAEEVCRVIPAMPEDSLRAMSTTVMAMPCRSLGGKACR